MYSKFLRGSSLLTGSNTVPGETLTKEEKEYFSKILVACKDYGLDFFPTIIQKVTYDEMSEIAAYGGFPRRFPHWQWGMEYEELQRGYEYGAYRIFELVINNDPCIIYILNSNSLLDNITVVAHATGHNDFFKNNVFFQPTNRDMVNKMANHASRIRKYIGRWGEERVIEFIDHVLRIQTLIDPSKAWDDRVCKDYVMRDSREYEFPRRVDVDQDRLYMEPWLNPKSFREEENERIKLADAAKELGIVRSADKDVFGFIKNYAPLKPWQADIVSMLYEEAMYFAPQRMTKTCNEMWASYIDYEIMTRQGYVGLGQKTADCGIIEYSKHKMSVLGGKYSMNPYKFFYLLMDIEERWDKGRFGSEYDNCIDIQKKENWDLNLGLGKEKVFSVRKNYDDVTLIMEYFTEEFCNKNEFFEWKKYPNGEYRIESRDYKTIKKNLLQRHLNGGLPDIRIADYNHKGKGWMFLEHCWDGREVHDPYAREVLASLYFLWGKEVFMTTRDKDGKELIFFANTTDSSQVKLFSRKEYDRKF